MSETRFAYLACSDGRSGALLDLIGRPGEAVARLALFQRGERPRVVRRTFAGEVFQPVPGGASLGPCRLDGERCEAEVEGVRIGVRLRPEGPDIPLVPRCLGRLIPTIPVFRSQPTTIVGGELDGAPLTGVPAVVSTYAVRDLARARWFLVSAQSFKGSDDRCEISGGYLCGRPALAGYLRLGGETIPLTHPLANLFRFRVEAAGDLADGVRRFRVSYRSRRLSLAIDAWAEESAFVELEREGTTTISTTLFGHCRLSLTTSAGARELTAAGTCLLEVKR